MSFREIKKIKLKNVESLFVIFSIVSFIFLWGYSSLIKLNYVILLYSTILLFINFFKKNLKILNINIFFVFFLLTHFFITSFIIKEFNHESLFAIGAIFLISYFVDFYKYYILNNLSLIINFFLIIFFINIIYDIFFIGIYQDFHLKKDLVLFPEKGYLEFKDACFNCKYSYFRAEEKFNYLIFKEISHFGMVAPAIILTKVLCNNNQNLTFNFFLLFFCIFTILFYSTSIIFSLLICSLFFIFLIREKFKFSKLIVLIFIIIFCTFTLLFNTSCNRKISDTLSLFKNNTNKFMFKSNTIDKVVVTVPKNLYNDKSSEFYEYKKKYFSNLSSTVFFSSFLVAFEVLKTSLLGYGFNNYEIAHKHYFENSLFELEDMGVDRFKNYNKKDGSNNFAKIVAEFGIISILLIFLLFKFVKNPHISLENKIFYITLILSQLVRGAGYFNGGFVFAILIMISSLSIKKKDD
jgi:hypothetical protein